MGLASSRVSRLWVLTSKKDFKAAKQAKPAKQIGQTKQTFDIGGETFGPYDQSLNRNALGRKIVGSRGKVTRKLLVP